MHENKSSAIAKVVDRSGEALTSIRWRRLTRATCCVTSAVFYTKTDAQCGKLTTVVGRTRLTTHAEFRTNFQMY